MDEFLKDGIKKAMDALFIAEGLKKVEVVVPECACTIVAYKVPPNVTRIDIKPNP